jgi:hypothetical protein
VEKLDLEHRLSGMISGPMFCIIYIIISFGWEKRFAFNCPYVKLIRPPTIIIIERNKYEVG